MPTLADQLDQVRDRIASACRQAARSPSEVTLVAVSKTHPAELLLEAARAGQNVFGENRVQEWGAKLPAVESAGFPVELAPNAPAAALQIHLIGQLQSNKARAAAELFTRVDTVDSLRLAERLARAASERNRILPVLLEIKTADEPSKAGLAPGSPELQSLLEHLPDLPSLQLGGLMTIAPHDPRPEIARSAFRALRTLRDELARTHPRLSFPTLSMGMSSDYELAIAEGSTEVRIGTAIFGAR